MSTDYTLNRVKLSNGKRLEIKIDDFIKHYNGYLTIEKKEQNNHCKSFGVKNNEGLYLWIYTDFDNIINGCCRYGSNWNENISSLLKSYLISQLDNKTLNYYQNEYSIDITQYLLIVEYDSHLFYDLYGDFKNHKLINDIWKDGYYESYKLDDLVDLFCDEETFTKDELINESTETLINQYMGIDEKYYKHLLNRIYHNKETYIEQLTNQHNELLEYYKKEKVEQIG